ncbi:hypothetical protein JCM16303_000393 [Sporobolomyces ruberrimus]
MSAQHDEGSIDEAPARHLIPRWIWSWQNTPPNETEAQRARRQRQIAAMAIYDLRPHYGERLAQRLWDQYLRRAEGVTAETGREASTHAPSGREEEVFHGPVDTNYTPMGPSRAARQHDNSGSSPQWQPMNCHAFEAHQTAEYERDLRARNLAWARQSTTLDQQTLASSHSTHFDDQTQTMPKATTSRKAAKPKGKKPPPPTEDEVDGEMQDEVEVDEEEMEEEEGDGERGNDATRIEETQFESREGTASKGKGKKVVAAPPAKKVVQEAATTTSTGSKRKAKDEGTRERDGDSEGDDRVTPREKKLKIQLEAKEKALADITAQFRKLSELRHTRAEESETRLKAIADERQTASANTIAAYKKEADTLRTENSSLQTTAYASPRSKAAQAVDRRVQELERQEIDMVSRVEQLEKEAREREDFWKEKLEKELGTREKEWTEEKELLSNDLETARNDYATEVAHSKSLQAKLKSIGPTSSATSLPAAAASTVSSSTSSATATKLAQVTEERDLAIRKLHFNEDLTGFMVNSVRGTDEPSYVCSLTDCWGTEEKSLNFKIVFYQDQTVGYTPDIQPERDALLSEILPPELQSYVRFDVEKCGEWFKRLYTAVNKRR